MGIKINGVEALNLVDKIGGVRAQTLPTKKYDTRAPDTFLKRALETVSPFLKAQNSLRNETILDISSAQVDLQERWWTDELAKLAPECISENSQIKPQIADTLKTLAQERNYLMVNLVEEVR